jgi:ubiquinone/menaquinone biosynthesis C-methylase UbiE
VARKYPDIQVEGFDISAPMIEYAQSKVDQDQISNLSFTLRDATQIPWPYNDGSFDLVNMSLIYAFTTCELWPQLIKEAYRILSPGGFLRVIQEDANITTNSPAMERLHQLGALALYRAGKSFYPNKLGVIPRLPGMFKRAGFQIVSQRRIIVDISAGTEGHIVAYEDYKILLRLLHPFLMKWGKAKAKEVDELYEQFLQEIQQGIPSEEGYLDPFVGSWDFYSIFGQKPA